MKQGKSEGFDSCDGLSNLIQFGFKSSIFQPCDLEIWRRTPKNNRALPLCYFKLFASFRSHWWIQSAVTVRKRLIWVKINDLFSRVTLKFDGWPSKTIGHLSYATSSFVQHFVAIGKLELQSENAQFGSKSTILLSRVTFKLDRWPWKTIGHLFYATSSFGHHFVPIGELRQPVCCVATVCHQIRCMYWGHLGHSYY